MIALGIIEGLFGLFLMFFGLGFFVFIAYVYISDYLNKKREFEVNKLHDPVHQIIVRPKNELPCVRLCNAESDVYIYMDSNKFGFKRLNSPNLECPTWLKGNSKIELDDEMIGFIIYLSNCNAKTEKKVLNYLMAYLKKINKVENRDLKIDDLGIMNF